jgi:predicted ATPase/DNA-binding SARP family transcriptional activator
VTADLLLLSRVSYRGQEVTGPRLRGLLALLAGDLRSGASTARLVDGLWPDELPGNPTKAVQILVSRVRAQLGAELIARTPTGYRLALTEEQVDASMILRSASASAQCARAGDHAAALAYAEAGLALWDGSTGEALDDPVSALRAERAGTYRSLLRTRALALSRLGRNAEAAEALAGLARDRPHDEEVLLELVRSEAATVGPSAALARYDAYRRGLRDELGTDPGPALRAEHRRLLQGAAPTVRHGVPHEPNPLLGRDDDVAAVLNLMRTSRVTSIVGAGGLGKTRLAHAVSRLAEQRTGYLVALAGITTDDDVVREVASVLGVGDSRRTPAGPSVAAPDVLGGIAAALGPGPALLVLDNCEHVVRGAAELVRALVSLTREVRVLTTSRTPLGLSSESVYLLPELSLPTSVELFGQRARAARPDVDLPAAAVEELCGHLDGLPLAVELAAARVRVMSVAEITRRLDDRFSLLRGGPRDAPQRHRTLHAVVDWSWNLLDPAGQAAMRDLSIFPGGFTADAAAHLVGGGDALETLEDLVDQSLLKVVDTAAGARFRMLETVREFSAAQREADGRTDHAVDGFLAWARAFGAAHHRSLFGADPFSALALIRAEQDNLVHAMRYGLARADGATVAAASAVLAAAWVVESNYPGLATLVEETSWLLSHYRPGPGCVETTRTAAALLTAYTFAIEGPRAVRSLVVLRRLPPAPPDTLVRAAAIVVCAVCERVDALHALCDSAEPLLAGVANSMAAYVWESANDVENALKCARRTLDAFESGDVPWSRALAHARITELCLQVERGDEAVQHLTAALPVLDRLGSGADAVGIRWWIVLANLQRGALDEAERWMAQIPATAVGDAGATYGYDLGVRAEVQLARGEIDAGLDQWRRLVHHLRTAGDISPGVPAGLDPWIVEAQAVAVAAHAQHGRVDLVREIVDDLRDRLRTMLAHPVPNPPPFLLEFRSSGTILLALAMTDLDRGARTGDAGASRSGVRLVALAERFRYLRNFQPTMSGARARRAAEEADRSAYADAVSSYADLDPAGLRAAALAALGEL